MLQSLSDLLLPAKSQAQMPGGGKTLLLMRTFAFLTTKTKRLEVDLATSYVFDNHQIVSLKISN